MSNESKENELNGADIFSNWDVSVQEKPSREGEGAERVSASYA